MHFGDSIFIFLLALVLFGPKKLPEIGRTIGKLLAEFRRASNEFKFQIQEELRNMEEDERRKKLAEAQAQKAAEATALPEVTPSSTGAVAPSILPPSTGTPVSASAPYATPVAPAEPALMNGTVEPAAAEVVVESSTPSSTSVPAVEAASEASSHVDLARHSNGTHPSAPDADPASSSVTGEAIHHG
jgi:sec-independent protein translocase protein TatB